MKVIYILVLILGFSWLNAAAQNAPKPKIINAGVVNGKAKSLPKPEYPAAAQAVRAAGAVNIQVIIDENGNIVSAAAVSGHPLLRQAAEQAARQAVFTPTTLSGQPVKVSGVIVYNFIAPDQKEKAPIWAFGMFLSVLQSDSLFISQIGDDKELTAMLADMATDVPEQWKSEKPLFDKLAKATPETRRQIAGEILDALKIKMNPDEVWQTEMGESFGTVLKEILGYVKNLKNSAPVDETRLKASLQKVKSFLNSAPPETSPELISKFRSIADFADQANLTAPENLERLMKAIEPLFGSFSDE